MVKRILSNHNIKAAGREYQEMFSINHQQIVLP